MTAINVASPCDVARRPIGDGDEEGGGQMTSLIVLESMFGNTRRIAEEIAAGLGSSMPVEILDVSKAPSEIPETTPLLVVGGPTHAFGMSRPATRDDAVKRGADANPEVGVRDWLETLRIHRPGLPAVSFDTRVDKRFVPGSAARAIARRLREAGCTMLEAPVTFYVEDVDGPLTEGEERRAREFGQIVIRDLERRGLRSSA
jgi:hypothetical protein